MQTPGRNSLCETVKSSWQEADVVIASTRSWSYRPAVRFVPVRH